LFRKVLYCQLLKKARLFSARSLNTAQPGEIVLTKTPLNAIEDQLGKASWGSVTSAYSQVDAGSGIDSPCWRMPSS